MSAPDTTKSDTGAAKTVETGFKPIPEGLGRRGTSSNDIRETAERLKSTGVTQLHLAAEEGNADRVEQLLSKDKSELDLQDPDGMTALAIAAKNKNMDVVRVLLRWNPRTDLPDKARMTALHWAAQNGDVGIMEQLLAAGDSAKTSGTTSTRFDGGREVQGSTESTFLAITGAPTGTRDLGLDDRVRASEGQASGGPTANVDLLDSESRTPLYLASESGSVDAVRLLLERGADDRLRDERGRTPLEAAAVAGRKDVTGLLSDSWGTGSGSRGRARTYFLLPHFDTPPPPDGPLNLGTIIADPKTMQPLSPGGHIPPRSEWIHRKHSSGFRTTLAQTQTGQYGLWAKILGLNITAELSQAKDTSGVIEVGTLDDMFFVPPRDYLTDCVAALNDDFSRLKPVYMVTGMKIVRDASFARSSGTNINAKVEIASVGVNAGADVKQLLRESFVLAVRLSKISYKRSIFSRKPAELRISSYNRGAVF